MSTDHLSKVVSLCKRRGFVFPNSEIYGGLRSTYDYGPLGVELKKNIAQAWWKSMVYDRRDIYGLDASILMRSEVWKTSGHLDHFADPLVDCFHCQERFRADKAPTYPEGTVVFFKKKGEKLQGKVGPQGYVCPFCHSPDLSPERPFLGMFRTSMGAVDPVAEWVKRGVQEKWQGEEWLENLSNLWGKHAVYLRPETAQAIFVQFSNIVQSMNPKMPFGIAQIGKSFRNEIIVEHFIFRSCEFEQMEMEFFCEPGTEDQWLDYWCQERLRWYRAYGRKKEAFRLRPHEAKELAHYASGCYDVEYAYPWGWGELEGIASRTDYDLKNHEKVSGVKLSYWDGSKIDPQTGRQGWRYTPYVIEPAAGLTRAFLCFLLDSYEEEDDRCVLKLHPALAPIKAAILPLVKKDGQPEMAEKILKLCQSKGIYTVCEDQGSIGKRYARHDEIGTPFAITVDQQSLVDETVTLRFRDDRSQHRYGIQEAVEKVCERTGLLCPPWV